MPPKVNRYREYDPSLCEEERDWPGEKWLVASYDPSTTEHFAVRVSERYFSGSSRTLHCSLLKVGKHWKKTERKKDFQVDMFNGLTSELENLLPLLHNCHVHIIEEQRNQAYENILIAQHALSFLLIHLRNSPLRPLIYSVESALKTDIFKGTVWGKSPKEDTKKWSERVGPQILEERSDTQGAQLILSHRRKHDLYDVVCQEEAFFLHLEQIGRFISTEENVSSRNR